MRQAVQCAAGMLVILAVLVVLDRFGWLEGWFVVAYGGP